MKGTQVGNCKNHAHRNQECCLICINFQQYPNMCMYNIIDEAVEHRNITVGSVYLHKVTERVSGQDGVSGQGGVSGHTTNFLSFWKYTATERSCSKSVHMPHLRALCGCSLVSSSLSTATNER